MKNFTKHLKEAGSKKIHSKNLKFVAIVGSLEANSMNLGEHKTEHIDTLIHEATKGSLHEEKLLHLDPQTRRMVRTIHKRYQKRINAENELRKLRRTGELNRMTPETFLFTLLADYAIDLAIRREEKQPAQRKRHKQRLQRMWQEYSNRVLRYS